MEVKWRWKRQGSTAERLQAQEVEEDLVEHSEQSEIIDVCLQNQ